MNTRVSIDNLIEIVKSGGTVKTGIDVYSDNGVLLLDRDIMIDKVKPLEIIKSKGIHSVPVSSGLNGGLWDKDGRQIKLTEDGLVEFEEEEDLSHRLKKEPEPEPDPEPEPELDPDLIPPDMASEIEARLKEIEEIRNQANEKYSEAKENIKKVLTDIKNTGGEFDYEEVASNVSKLVDFLSIADNPFSYLTHEIFSYDDYLYNHSVNVCAIGTAVAHRFNKSFSKVVDNLISGSTGDMFDPFEKGGDDKASYRSFTCFYPDDLHDISLGFFLHDIGKILVPDEILNKKGRLTDEEFLEVKKHSFEYGGRILDRNRLTNSVIKHVVEYHHAPLHDGEERCYPQDKPHYQIPLYVRICKLADIYDAMTSKRCYKEAFNPINVVTQLFRTYAKKDQMLQYILHAFVKSIGIYPPGSIVFLHNGQMAYVLESDGPLLLPFTDKLQSTLNYNPDPYRMDTPGLRSDLKIDSRRSVKAPKEVHDLLPSFIKNIALRPAV